MSEVKSEAIKIELSDKLATYLEKFNSNKIAKMLLNLNKKETPKANLISGDNFVNYLNLKDDFSISYIKTSSIIKKNVENVWLKSRQHCALPQVISKIFNADFLNQLQRENVYKQTDVEELSAMFRADQMKNNKIEILRGFDILEAYNFTKKIDVRRISSCANFNQPSGGHNEPKIKWFYPYIYNKESLSLIVVKDLNGNIKGRVTCFEGLQQEDSGTLKKGEHIKYINHIYAEETAYKQLIKDYCVANKILIRGNFTGTIVIPFKCRYKTWPPMDYMSIDTEKNLILADGCNFNNKYKLKSTYKLAQDGGNHNGKNTVLQKV